MKCLKCGKEFDSSLEKCPYCNEINRSSDETISKLKKQRKMAIAIVILLAAAIGLYSVWNEYVNVTRMDLSKNMKILITGVSGEASIIGVNNNLTYDRTDAQMAKFIKEIYYEYSKETGINNGDTIKVTAVYDKQKAKELKLKIVNPVKTFKVKDLNYRFTSAENIPETLRSLARTKGEKSLKNKYKTTKYEKFKFSYYASFFLQRADSDSIIVAFRDDHYTVDAPLGFPIGASVRYYYYEIASVDSGVNSKTINQYETDTTFFYSFGHGYIENPSEIPSLLKELNHKKAINVTKID